MARQRTSRIFALGKSRMCASQLCHLWEPEGRTPHERGRATERESDSEENARVERQTVYRIVVCVKYDVNIFLKHTI